MKKIVSEEITSVFYDSFKYLEEIENLISGGRYSKDDFERINVLYDIRNLHRNSELTPIYKLIIELPYSQNTSNLVQQIDSYTAKILTTYRRYHQTIFIVDGEFAYANFTEAIVHALFVGLDKIKNPLKLTSIAEVLEKDNSLKDGEVPNLKNYFDFQFDHKIFKDLGVELTTVNTTHKSKALKIIDFLCDIHAYTLGDSIGTMTSKWHKTKTNKKRWTRGDWEVLIDGKGNTTHFCDLDTEGICIYMNSSFTGSSTSQYQYSKNTWVMTKQLNRLIR
ncbi:MAG: hypothetical protein ACON5K_11565 [Bacteroidia bacterium]